MAIDSTPMDGNRAAARQWARRCAAGLSAAEQTEFQAWLGRAPAHRTLLAAETAAGADCDWAWAAGATDEILGKLEVRKTRRRRRRAALATVAAVALAVGGVFWHSPRVTPATVEPPADLVVVSPVQQVLPDGSIVELDDTARITTEFTPGLRLVHLTAGTAHFKVAKNPLRPFVVKAGEVAVQAVGTAFTVSVAPTDLNVLVTEGHVRVDAANAAPVGARPTAIPLASLSAMQAAGFTRATGATSPTAPARRETLTPAEISARESWRSPKMEFSAAPVREVIARMNRQNHVQLVLADTAVGELRISGVLRADKVDTLADMLAADFGVKVERNPDQIVLRRGR